MQKLDLQKPSHIHRLMVINKRANVAHALWRSEFVLGLGTNEMHAADSRKIHVTHLRHSQQIIAIFLPAEYVMVVLQRLKPLED